MEELKKLGPFSLFCQILGLLPFRMQIDPQTNRLKRFPFSFRRPPIWWFIFLKILPGLVFAIELYFSRTSVKLNYKDDCNGSSFCNLLVFVQLHRTNPLLFSTMATVAVSFNLNYLIIQLFPLRCSRLVKAIEWIQKADETLTSLSDVSNRVTGHIYVGMASVLFLPSLLIIWPLMADVSHSSLSILQSPTVMVTCFMINCQMLCLILLVHLSYYMLANRIAFMRQLISEDEDLNCNGTELVSAALASRSRRQISVISMKMKNIRDGFNVLCQCAEELNSFSSSFSCYVLITKVISSSIYLFFVASVSVHSNGQKSAEASFAIPYLLIDIIYLAVLFKAADSPVGEVVQLREEIMQIPARILDRPDDQFQVMSTIMQVTEDRVQLTALGMFRVGIHLVPCMAGTIITYFVTLLQFDS